MAAVLVVALTIPESFVDLPGGLFASFVVAACYTCAGCEPAGALSRYPLRMAADPVIEPRRFTVEEYELMGQVGILDPDERVELLDGEIVAMSPVGPPHASVVDIIAEQLYSRLIGRVSIRVQNPVRLLPRSEPEPDIAVARRRRDFYRSAHPTAEDILLVIEVADTSLRKDRMTKIPIYARQGVVEAWVVDLLAEVVHVHTDPVDGVYRKVQAVAHGGTLCPVEIADLRLTVDEILGD